MFADQYGKDYLALAAAYGDEAYFDEDAATIASEYLVEQKTAAGEGEEVANIEGIKKLEIVYSLILALCNSYVGKSCISIIRSVILMCLTLDTIVNNSTCTVTSKQILTYILCDLLIRNCLVE